MWNVRRRAQGTTCIATASFNRIDKNTPKQAQNLTFWRLAGSIMCLAALAGCASFPSSGPTVGRIEKMAKSSKNQLGFEIIPITADTLPPEKADNSGKDAFGEASVFPLQNSDAIRNGDTLTISIYEVGIGLFGSSGRVATSGADPTATAHNITIQVDDEGLITFPYIGRLNVMGNTPEALARYIETQLRRFSESPQVIVGIADTVENTAYVSGSVARPGRYRLSSAREHLLDIITLAGGASTNVDDVELHLEAD